MKTITISTMLLALVLLGCQGGGQGTGASTATIIAVSAAHRPDVFSALHYSIDRLKEIVPIWKKEVWADGEEWKSESPAAKRGDRG